MHRCAFLTHKAWGRSHHLSHDLRPQHAGLKLTQKLAPDVALRVRPRRLRQLWMTDLKQSDDRRNMLQPPAGAVILNCSGANT